MNESFIIQNGMLIEYTGTEKEITIPDGVTEIADKAFRNNAVIVSAAIPGSVRDIGKFAFAGCTSLASIVISESVTRIGEYAFYGCASLEKFCVNEKNPEYSSDESGALYNKEKTKLIRYPQGSKRTSFVIPNGVTEVCEDAFEDCTNLVSVTVPDSITEIDKHAFTGYTNLAEFRVDENNPAYSSDESGVLYDKGKKRLIRYPQGKNSSFVVPDGVKWIEWSAFECCAGLTSVTIPNGVKEIGMYTFDGCVNLRSVVIPESVTEINVSAFNNCTSMAEFRVDEKNPEYSSDESGALYNKDKTRMIRYPQSGKKTTFAIPDSVTQIEQNAFRDCTSPVSVVIPDSMTAICGSAFDDCAGLTSVTIPDSVTHIDMCAFTGCTNLTEFRVDENNPAYSSDESGVLYNKEKTMLIRYPEGSKKTSFTIPNGVTQIYPDAITVCTNLVEFRVDENNPAYSSDESGVLYNKEKTTLIRCPQGSKRMSFMIPNGVTEVDDDAFKNCTSLQSISIPIGVTAIGWQAFEGCTSLQSFTIPIGVTTIGWRAFEGCTSLQSVSIPDSVTKIGSNVFEGCTNLQSVTIPDSVTEISPNVFKGCTSLQSVTIPNSVTEIGEEAFEGCTSLQSVTIPGSVTKIGFDTFGDCTSLVEFCVDENNPAYSSDESGTLYNKEKTVLIRYPEGSKRRSFVIPDSVTEICKSAFFGCIRLKEITIPGSVKKIGLSAFDDNLRTVYYRGNTSQYMQMKINEYNDELFDAEWI